MSSSSAFRGHEIEKGNRDETNEWIYSIIIGMIDEHRSQYFHSNTIHDQSEAGIEPPTFMRLGALVWLSCHRWFYEVACLQREKLHVAIYFAHEIMIDDCVSIKSE